MKWRAPLAWLHETLLQKQASDTGHSNLSLCPRIFSVLSAILYLGNVTYKKRATGRDEGLEVGPPEVLDTLSELLKVPPVSTIPPCTCFLATASMVSTIHGRISTHRSMYTSETLVSWAAALALCGRGLSSFPKPCRTPTIHKPDVLACPCHPSTWEVKGREISSSGPPGLHETLSPKNTNWELNITQKLRSLGVNPNTLMTVCTSSPRRSNSLFWCPQASAQILDKTPTPICIILGLLLFL